MSVQKTIRRSLFLAAIVGVSQTSVSSAGEEEASVATACLRRTDIRTMKILSDRNILFITRDRTMYNNQLMRQCPGLTRNAVPSLTYANNGKLCSGSTFTVLYRSSSNTNRQPYWDPFTQKATTLDGPGFITGPTCQIGLFGPVTEDEVKALVAATDEPKPSRRRTDRDAVRTKAAEPTPAAERPAIESPAAR